MRKLIFTFACAFAITTMAKSQQSIADFQNSSDYTISSFGYAVEPSVGDDPADAANKVLIIEKNVDGTFDQAAKVKLAASVTVAAGNTRFTVDVKSTPVGTRGYIKVYTASATREGWTSNITTTADTYETLLFDGLVSGDVIDSVEIILGGWDNGNAPAGLQGTYYVDKLVATAPPAVIVDPRIVVEIPHLEEADEIELDGLDAEDSWSMDYQSVANGDSAAGFAADFIATWDENYLYFVFDITDATPFAYDGTDSWKKDGVQVYFDVRNQLLEGRKDNNSQHQIAICNNMTQDQIDGWDGTIVANIYTNMDNEYYVDVASLPGASGYSMEFRIPWASMYFNNGTVATYEDALAAVSVGKNSLIGFEVQANDYDEGTTNREHVLTWSSFSTDDPGAYQNSGVWGALKLTGGDEVGISDVATANARIFPNPANDILNVVMPNISQVEVINMVGNVIINTKAVNHSASIDISSLSSGVYMIRTTDIDGNFAINKINVN